MAIKLNSLSRWQVLAGDRAISFDGSDVAERRVRINFNCEAVTSFYVEQDGRERFLCTLPPGLETVEFNFAGSFRVFAEDGSGAVLYQSADLEPTFSEIVDPVIFTRIANRRHRNPELEEIMYRMQANIERRLAQQAHELEAAFERRRKELENGRPAEIVVSDAPGAVASVVGQPVSASGADGESAGVDASAADGSQQSGGAGG